MQTYLDIMANYWYIIAIALLAVALLALIIIMLVLVNKISKLNNRVDTFFGASGERRNIEVLLEECLDKTNLVASENIEIRAAIDETNERLGYCVSKVGVIRYNPFEDIGYELSFVVALLDDHNNGLIINTIHSRESSHSYAKRITNLESSYELSEEELEAIRIATKPKNI